MAKAIFIMDMPESCDMCDFADDTQPPRYGEQTLYCIAPGIGDDVTDYIACRPDWCPLRELPEKIPELKSGYKDLNTSIRRVGWNACLDESLKERKE
jgi:hypothetical protein